LFTRTSRSRGLREWVADRERNAYNMLSTQILLSIDPHAG